MSLDAGGLNNSPIFSYGNIFPNPYYDIANTYIPRDIKKTFQWCDYLFLTNGILATATKRVVNYFITEIQYKTNTQNTEKLKEILEKKLKIKQKLANLGTEYIAYGNSINAMYFPFHRKLICPKCSFESNAKKVDYKFEHRKYIGTCKKCNKLVTFEAKERANKDSDKINIIRLDPKAINIKRHPLSGNLIHFWEIPKNYQKYIKHERDKFYIDDTPAEFIDAVYDGKTFKWDQKYIYHVRNETLSGFPLGWGCPFFLHILKLSYYAAILRRANETIALDFVVPFRVISPGTNSPSFDPAMTHDLGDFASQMRDMVHRHRYDPADIQISPFPINYQAFGGEKKALEVSGEVKSVIEEMLHSLNYPAELFFNTLRVDALPPALRLFENTWGGLITGMNDYLQWTSDHICSFMGWGKEEVSLARVTVADDMEKRQVMMQLASANQISLLTALKPYGIDLKEEQKRIAEQNKMIMNAQRELEEEMAVEQQLAPPEQGGQGATSPGDINTQAQMQAQQLLNMPEEYRVRAMRQLESANPTLHALTKQVMEKIRSQARSQGQLDNLAAMGMTGHRQMG
jgi:hypothetical protein